jgi:hypothetical protein
MSQNTLGRCLWLGFGLLAGASAMASEVNVQTAWYGQSCGTAHGNVTAHVKSRCDGRASCDYRIDAMVLGDPAPNCAKNFVVLYACRGQAQLRLAQVNAEADGKGITVSCLPPPQPIALPPTAPR